jgi:hypothetical protein
LSEKIGLPSSVLTRGRNDRTDTIRIRVKEDFDIASEVFLSFLRDTFKACPK